MIKMTMKMRNLMLIIMTPMTKDMMTLMIIMRVISAIVTAR